MLCVFLTASMLPSAHFELSRKHISITPHHFFHDFFKEADIDWVFVYYNSSIINWWYLLLVSSK